MKRKSAFVAAIALCAVSSVHAEYSVTEKGTWPQSWPKELEPLRKQARTYEGPLAPDQHYGINFSTREEFESAWPHILKVKSKGASVRLVRGPNFFLGRNSAGVVVHSPALGQADDPATPEAPGAAKVRTRGLHETYIELVVDGQLVDLNRIPLPPNTPIDDARFKDGTNK